jgi:outer membrane lipoprotein SlyB
MNTTTQSGNSPHRLMWIAAIAVILFCVAGIAAILGWIPTSMGRNSENPEITKPGKLTANTPKPTTAKTPVTATKTPVQPTSPVTVASATKCIECGVIGATREVTTKGEGSGLGAVGGAVVGGLLGNQVGSGRGNTAATAIGAVGGAVAGNEIEKRVKAGKSYEVTVRMDDGSSRVISQNTVPAWRSGDHVKVVGGVIHANP